ncbi:hypothetical protein MTO96_037039 [Rhipicephalus appendiculatus]|uniref:THAP-type domain-containing protein n=1 Tax=Rhipicephalus appendiculatus TaxID=34631 RepID=A0A131YBL5_RHIAP
MEQDASAITCNIRGCPNEFGLSDPSHLLYVCTADDIQCKAWLAVIPKVSLRDVGERLCVCSLHFADGVNVSGDIVPTIFPPVPVAVPAVAASVPTPPPSTSLGCELTLVGPAVKIKEEPIDDYEQEALASPKMEDSEHFDSTGECENDESSMDVDQPGLIPVHAIKREIEDDSTEGLTSSSTQEVHGDDSAQNGEDSHFLRFVTSYTVKEEVRDEEDEEGVEIAAPPPGSGCGVVTREDSSSACAFKIQEFGEIPVEEIKTEDGVTPTFVPSARPSTSAVRVKTEPPDVVANGLSHDQGCQAGNLSSVVLMPPGLVSEPSSSVAAGSTAFAASSNGVLMGETGIVISNVQSVSSTSAQECFAEDVVHCPKCINGEAKERCDKSTCTNMPTRTVFTQTVEPERRTVWTQVAQLGDLKMLKHRATQTDPWLERSPRLPKVVRKKRRLDEDDTVDKP